MAVDLLKNLGLSATKVVVVLDKDDETLKKSFRNIADVKYLLVNYLNPYDIMHADTLLFTEPALQSLNTMAE
jgi:large subunit ribosomal protein L4